MAKANGNRPGKKQTARLPRDVYEKELYRLQAELVKMQEWLRSEGARIVVIFEAGTRPARAARSNVSRVPQPRLASIVALPAPTERERSEWYFQRYVSHLPAAGRLVLFDRSWYNRAGVEHVMGFCTKEEYSRFLHQCPSSSGCWSRKASCCASTGSPSATRSSSAGSSRGWRTRCAGGSCPPWTSSPSPGGRTTRGQG